MRGSNGVTLGDEEESRRSIGDGLHVFLIVAAVVARQQVVEDPHDAHQEQEEEDALSKQVARSALRGLSHVSDKVFLPDDKVDKPSEGSGSLTETQAGAPHHCQERGISVHAITVGTGNPFKSRSFGTLIAAFSLHLLGKESILKHADEGDDDQEVDVLHHFAGVHDH